MNRRDFLKHSSAVLATGLIVPTAMGEMVAKTAKKENGDTVRVGLIGGNEMGWNDLFVFLMNPEVECVALCDVDKNILDKRCADVLKLRGNTPKLFSDYREMLKMKDLDIVIVGTPDHWHCLQVVDACAAGKAVYTEKPIANYIAECDAMVAAAKKHNSIVCVGQQQRSGNHWKSLIEFIHSGRLGRIARVDVWGNFDYGALGLPQPDAAVPAGVDYNTWLGPAAERTFNPEHFHGSWRMFWNYGGGLMTDWGVHLLDIALWGMKETGMPKTIVAQAGKYAFPDNSPETFDTQSVVYNFDDYMITWNHTAGTNEGPWKRGYGVAFKGTNGILVADRENWEVISEYDYNKKANKIGERLGEKADGKDHIDHIKNFVNCVKTGDHNTPCTLENGSLCAKYAHLGNIAARTGLMLTYDDAKKTFNNAEADKYLKPNYRAPWKFPNI